MKNAITMLGFEALVLVTLSAANPQHQVSSQTKRDQEVAWLEQDNVRRLVRLLKDFSEKHKGHDAEEVACMIQKFGAPETKAPLDAETTRRLLTLLTAYRVGSGAYDRDARFLLAALGDPEQINALIEELRPRRAFEGLDVPERLSRSRQPLVIRNLAKELFSDDDLLPSPREHRVYPPSVNATVIITSILTGSPAFSDDVKNWAEGLSKLKTEKQRELLRLWWEENKQFFDTLHYHRVAPPSPDKYTLTPEDYKPKRSPIRKVQ